MQRGFGHYVGGTVRWLLVVPVAVVVYMIASALTAILGAWYLTGGGLAFLVSVFTATFPYWILVHIFDPATVIYLVQSLIGAPLAIAAAALVAPAHRFRTATALFVVQIVLIAAQVLIEVMGGVAPEYLHAPWVLGASALLGVVGGLRVVLAMRGVNHPVVATTRESVTTRPTELRGAITDVALKTTERPTAVRRVRIVVVDDIEDTTRNIAKLIGFESDMEVVGMAFDGMEGVAVTRATKPDIVLMDIHMPVMDGITATATIGEGRDFEGAVIMMSVEGEQDYIRRSMLAGALEYLVKPFSADELIDAIRNTHRIMEKRRAQAALHHQLTAEAGSR